MVPSRPGARKTKLVRSWKYHGMGGKTPVCTARRQAAADDRSPVSFLQKRSDRVRDRGALVERADGGIRGAGP